MRFNDLHICFLIFNITDCDQNYMQMLNHQINDKKSVGLCSLFSFLFCFKYFRARPQYFDYFHMKLFDGFLFRVSVDWALKRPGERFKKQAASVGPHHWMVSCGRRKDRWLKCNLQRLAHHRGDWIAHSLYEWRNVKEKTRQEQFSIFCSCQYCLYIYL